MFPLTNPPPDQDDVSAPARGRDAALERYSVPNIYFPAWVLSRAEWRGDEKVLDIGCGSGAYFTLLKQNLPDIQYTGADLSANDLKGHPDKDRCQVIDSVQSLPYENASYDVVLMNTTLVTNEEHDAILMELNRVLKPEGVLICATTSLRTMPEIQALMRRALVLLGASGRSTILPGTNSSLSLENGARRLAPYFYAVVRHDLPTQLLFPDLDPVMDFLESLRPQRETTLPDGIYWDDIVMVIREQVAALLAHFGELPINRLGGVLIASNKGGFISNFVKMRDNGN